MIFSEFRLVPVGPRPKGMPSRIML